MKNAYRKHKKIKKIIENVFWFEEKKYYFSTDWCHRIASDPRPLTKRWANDIVSAVFSASNSKFVFSAIAVLNSLWIEFKRDSISYRKQTKPEVEERKKIACHLFCILDEISLSKWMLTKILLLRKSNLSWAAFSSFCASSKALCFGSTTKKTL